MSHWTQLSTKFRDADVLGDALRDLFPAARVDVGEGIRPAKGYQGQRPRPCIVAARAVGAYDTDLGGRRTTDGTIALDLDGYTADRYRALHSGRHLAEALAQRYAYHAIRQQARAQGLSITYDSTAPVERSVNR